MNQTTAEPGDRRAASLEDLKPLIELCKAGQPFAVQRWLEQGKPVNLPDSPRRSSHARTPLDIAIERGFHSLVEVLLRAGATINLDSWNGSMQRALKAKRFDLVQLLVQHGYDPKSIDMKQVFDTWEPEIAEYFIDRGADVETGYPLAYALSSRIRTALRILKRYSDRFASFPEQANIALRHHCKEGNLKWVSLMLWAGADAYAPGLGSYDEERYAGDGGLSALGFAMLYRHYEVFGLKQVKLDPAHPSINCVMRYADRDEGVDILARLLKQGLNPNDQENGGSSQIQSLLTRTEWDFDGYNLNFGPDRTKLDTDRARDRMKAIHVLAKHGAKWVPKEAEEVKRARRSLLKLTADYTVEFVWLMSKFTACSKEAVQSLLATPSMKKHVLRHAARLQEILLAWPEPK